MLIVSVLFGDFCRLIIKKLYSEYKVRVEAIQFQTIALVHFMQQTLSFEDIFGELSSVPPLNTLEYEKKIHL